MTNIGILGIGSNYRPEKQMLEAERQLTGLFPGIRFSPAVYTTPDNMRNPALFLNRVAIFSTELPETEVRRMLKQTETLLGRTPEDKRNERIAIDLDLVKWNDRILKPADFERAYLAEGIRFLLP